MANGLAGLFVDPAQYQRERDLAFDKDALTIAQLDPFQRAEYNIASGARRLGGAIGGLLGGVDPELERIKETQALLQQQDLTTPEGLLEAAKVLQKAGQTKEALALVGQSQKMELDASTIAKQRAEANKKAGLTGKAAEAEFYGYVIASIDQLDAMPEEAKKNPDWIAAKNRLVAQRRFLEDVKPDTKTEAVKNAEAFANAHLTIRRIESVPEAQRTPEQQTELFTARTLASKLRDKDVNFGELRDAISRELAGGKTFAEVTDPQSIKAINDRVNYIENQRRASGASRVNVETKYETKASEEAAKSIEKQIDEAATSARLAGSRLLSHLKVLEANPTAFQGGLAPFATQVGNVLSSVGIKVEGTTPAQIIEQVASTNLYAFMSAMGARGLTNEDMMILRQMLPQVGTSREARQAVSRILIKDEMRTMEAFRSIHEGQRKSDPVIAGKRDVLMKPVFASYDKNYVQARKAIGLPELTPERRTGFFAEYDKAPPDRKENLMDKYDELFGPGAAAYLLRTR